MISTLSSGCKVFNWSDPESRGSVYIGRPSKWGNPFTIGVDGTRTEVIEAYRVYLYRSGLISDISELTGKNLVCWCKPKACHGDILIQLANDPFGDFYE